MTGRMAVLPAAGTDHPAGGEQGREAARRMGRLRWTVVFDPPRDGAVNMAVDHALAETVDPDAGWLRLYRWTRPTLSLGRNEPAADCYDFERAARLGVDVVRRPTGGRGVLHDAELTYAVVAPIAAAGRLRAAYAAVHAGLAAGLRALGADARLAAGVAPGPPRAGACFDATAGGEVVAGGRKLTGSAQARIGRALLQHGSVLIDGTQELARKLCRQPADADAAPASTTLREQLGRTPTWEEVAKAVTEGLAAGLETEIAQGPLPRRALPLIRPLERRYRSREWTLRR
ncbi:MAG: biotin/lipoate A/B protein ligase family protein [Gammaproteobacteria bacterium]|nr:biotin/lipoate A/B protein ligase family protein [Gammaproteobacteria bacterium]